MRISDNIGINIGRTFVVWCQGESDGDDKVPADTYTENTKELFNIFKQHGVQKCFMVQIGHYRDGGTTDTRYKVIRDAQAALCENDSDFILAGSFEPYQSDMKDKYHYNQTAYNAVGKTVGKNISEFYGVN
ncbi:MAG: sialate O-acetylesterase [bacterium]|nr:sialate O-acetylesterase [bacterium]